MQQNIRSFKRGAVMTTAVLLLTTLTTAPTRADQRQTVEAALSYAPADAGMVLIAPNLAQLSDKIAVLNQKLELGSQEMADLLTLIKTETGAVNGLRDDGALIVVMKKLEGGMMGAKPELLIFAPVADYAAFIGNYEGQADADIAELVMPGAPGFAKKIDNYALLSPDQAVLAAYQKPEAAADQGGWLSRVGALGQGQLSRDDVIVCLNVEPLAPSLGPMLGMAMFGVNAQIAGDPNTPMEMRELGMAMLNKFSSSAAAVIRDTSLLIVSFDLDDVGSGATLTWRFKPDSDLGKLFKDGKPAKLDLKRIPDKPFAGLMAVNTMNWPVDELLDRATANLPASLAWVTDIVTAIKPMYNVTQNVVNITYAPTDDSPMNVAPEIWIHEVTQTQPWLDSFQAMFPALEKMRIPMPDPGAGPNDPLSYMSVETEYKVNALQIDGVSVHEYQLSFNLPEALQQDLNLSDMLKPINGYVAVKGQRVVVAQAISDQALLADVLNRLDHPTENPAHSQVAAMPARALSPGANVIAFQDLSQIIATVNHQFEQLGMAFPLPEKTAMLSESVRIRDHSISIRAYSPHETSIEIKKLAEQMAPMLGQFGGGGDFEFQDDELDMEEEPAPQPRRRAPLD